MSAPTPEFLSLPNATPEEADILLLPVPLERTVSFKPGTAEAPGAILAATDQLEYYEEDIGWSPLEQMLISVLPPVADRGEEERTWHDNLTRQISRLPETPLFVALGGEHSITPSLVAGRMPEPGTILFLDAHADLRTSYQGSQFSHACPAYRLLEQGHSLIMAGIRSIYESEAQLAAEHAGINMYTDRQLQRGNRFNELLDTVGAISGPVYLSIDLDAFDPAVVPGVGTPQPGGFSWHQALDILDALFANRDIDLRGVDLVEMVPEPSRVSEMVAAKLLLKIFSGWGHANGFGSKPKTGSQTRIDYE